MNLKYGRLTLQDSFIKNNRRYWNCICDCGNKMTTLQQSLKSGRVNSCGCLKKERAAEMCRKRKLPGNESVINDLIYKYKLRSKKENIEWDLTKEQCLILFKDKCHYCGCEPHRIKRVWSSSFIFNGIDRVDNDKGYTSKNVVSCCTRCNYMKSDLTKEEFLNHVKKIMDNVNAKNI